MKYFLYTIYDPRIDSFSERIIASPLDPENMGEQYRRMYISAEAKDKAFFEGKKAAYLGEFDDVSGKISQDEILIVHEFKEEKHEGESKEDEKCQEPSQSSPKA